MGGEGRGERETTWRCVNCVEFAEALYCRGDIGGGEGWGVWMGLGKVEVVV